MSEQLRFYTLEQLETMSLGDLQTLWELVPTDRQRAYRQAYEREVRNAGALGSDLLEQQVTAELLTRYRESALVPVGSRWAKTPLRVQEAAKSTDGVTVVEDVPAGDVKKPSPLLILAAVGIILLLAGIFLFTNRARGDTEIVAEITAEIEATATPLMTATPTPLALEAQDNIIREGDDERSVAYPVSLQLALPDGSPPRLWVVQRRAVRASEWNYDPNPDIASFINGMSVRPVMGIPYSEDNADWFENMGEGTVFTVAMNTGAILRFEFAARTAVRRSETDIFRQVSPGLVLLLIGERGDDGLPTATRTLITATYPPEQELRRDGTLAGLTLPELLPVAATATPVEQRSAFETVDVQVIAVTTQPGQLTTEIRLYNDDNTSLIVSGEDIWLVTGYVSNPAGPQQPAEALLPVMLLPGQAADLHLIWAWAGEPYARLVIGDYVYTLDLQ